MPLDIGGDFNSIKWMARDETFVANGDVVELEKAVFDLANIKQGWIKLQSGEAPQSQWDNGIRWPKPGDDWRRGFSVEIFAPKTFGDEELRTFMTNATGACMGMATLYAEFEEQLPKQNATTKVPLVKFNGADKAKVGKGDTSIPRLSIDQWIERPDALVMGVENEIEVVETEDEVEF